jgi:hypothetical protein
MKTTKEKNPDAKRVLTRQIYIPYEEKYEETKHRPGITTLQMKSFERIDRR